jgi:hypothetical protein
MKSPPHLTLRDLNRATLARQALLKREDISVTAMVERLAGMQMQLPAPPYVGLWTRLNKFERRDLAGLIESRKLVRATAMRGTLHLLSASDFRAFRPLLQPVLTRGVNSLPAARRKGIDMEAVAAEGREFFKPGPRRFEEVRDFLAKRHPKLDVRIMAHAVRMLVPLVQVPGPGAWGFPAWPAFALAESWLGEKSAKATDVQELARRYLAAFGPATAADLQTWSGLQGMRAVLEQLRPELVVLADERGRELFDLPKSPRPGGETPAPVRFLPEFDNLLLAHSDRTRVIPDPHKKRIFMDGLRVLPAFLVDGFVRGAWKVEKSKKGSALVIEPFATLSKKERDAVADEGEGLAKFMVEDGKATLVFK